MSRTLRQFGIRRWADRRNTHLPSRIPVPLSGNSSMTSPIKPHPLLRFNPSVQGMSQSRGLLASTPQPPGQPQHILGPCDREPSNEIQIPPPRILDMFTRPLSDYIRFRCHFRSLFSNFFVVICRIVILLSYSVPFCILALSVTNVKNASEHHAL